MTNREMLFKIQNVEPLIGRIKEHAKVIIVNTFDCYIQIVIDIKVSDTYVEIFYDYCIYNVWGKESVKIPTEWFDESFDYKSAYRELLREAEEKRVKAEAEEKQKQKKLQEKKDYKTYLKLKKKYENGDLT